MLNSILNSLILGENGFWASEYAGNSLRNYGIALLILLLLTLGFYILQKIVLAKLRQIAKRTKTDVDDALVETISSVKPAFYWLLAVYISFKTLKFPEITHRVMDAVILIIVVLQFLTVSSAFINFVFKKLKNKQKDQSSKYAYDYLAKISKGVIWLLGGLLILANLGINVTSLVAGLGIGGIAVAFALQNILGDLFSSFAIWFDKPFVIGDFIVVGPNSGTVEKIGIKSTRLRSLQGEEMIISNRELSSARIQNFKRLKERRVTFSVGVEYSTDIASLKEIPLIMQKIIQDLDSVRFSRAHFKSFGDSALLFEFVYLVESDNHDVYMDIQQQINLALLEVFTAKGIKMAYPTQTINLIQSE